MTVYKLTISLDATLAVQNQNGSFHYFKPSVGAEFTTDDTEDLTVLDKKFEDLYAEVIGPNFQAIVTEFLIDSDDKEEIEEKTNKDWTEEEIEAAKRDGVDLTLVVHPSVPLTEDDIRAGIEVAKKLGLQTTDDLPQEEWE